MKKTLALLLGLTAFSYAMADAVKPVGTAMFKNSVRIPAYAAVYQDPMEGKTTTGDVSCNDHTCDFAFSIPAEQAASLKLVKLGHLSWILAPKDATVSRAEVGANGSAVLTLKSPKAVISVYDSAACVGCAYLQASPYFDNAKRLATENFPDLDQTPPKKGLQSVRKDHTTAFYSYPTNGKTTHGLAKFFDGSTGNEDVTFNQMEITVDAKHKKLATTILNFYYHQNRR